MSIPNSFIHSLSHTTTLTHKRTYVHAKHLILNKIYIQVERRRRKTLGLGNKTETVKCAGGRRFQGDVQMEYSSAGYDGESLGIA